MYTGKEKCQGCKTPGTDKSRHSKNDLCDDCNRAFELGASKDFEKTQEYTGVSAWPNCSSLDWDDRSLSTFLFSFLEIMHNEAVETMGREYHPFNGDNHLGAKHFKIPTKLIEPLKEFFKTVDDFVCKSKEEREAIPELAAKEVKKEKDRIYNEGIEKGRNLLFQLNEGSVTQEDFIKDHSYKSKD